MCADCRWCWTVSITGVVYLQSSWPLPPAADVTRDQVADKRARRLLRSVDGLSDKLSGAWPAAELPAPRYLTSQDLKRLERARQATAADFFNEGLPLEQLKTDGVYLPPED